MFPGAVLVVFWSANGSSSFIVLIVGCTKYRILWNDIVFLWWSISFLDRHLLVFLLGRSLVDLLLLDGSTDSLTN